MVNCAHPTHFRDRLTGGAWLQRIGGIRANASKMSHAELDEAPELDAGDPVELGRDYRDLMALLPRLRVLGGCCGTDHRHIGGDQPCLRPPSPRGLSRRSGRRRRRTPPTWRGWSTSRARGWRGGSGRAMAEPGRGPPRGRRAARGARRGRLLLAQRGDRRGRRRGGRRPGRYRIGDAPEPVEEAAADRSGRSVELENRALGTHYVNVLATYAAFRAPRGRDGAAAAGGRAAGAAALSLIVADGNATARRLYEGFGFVERRGGRSSRRAGRARAGTGC